MKLPIDNLGYPTRIIVGKSSGSGFLIGHKNQIYLVTAKHVIYQQDNITKEFIPLGETINILCHTILAGKIQSSPRIYTANFSNLLSHGNIQSDNLADVLIIKLGTIDAGGTKIIYNPDFGVTQQAEGNLIYYNMEKARKFEDVEITNPVFVLGYPVSLSTNEMAQIDYDTPLVRKGIVAGKNYKNKTIILDCPVYGGNSGGMALEISEGLVDNIHLVGVVVQFVPFVEQWQNTRFPSLYNTHYQNSGYSIVLPINYIYELVQLDLDQNGK